MNLQPTFYYTPLMGLLFFEVQSRRTHMFYHLLFVTQPCCSEKLTATFMFQKVSSVIVETEIPALRIVQLFSFQNQECGFYLFPYCFFGQKKRMNICSLENAQFRSPNVTFFFLRKAIHYLVKLILAVILLNSLWKNINLKNVFLYSFRRNKKTVKDQSRQKAVPIKCKSDAGVT